MMLSAVWEPSSSYICPSAHGLPALIPLLQWIGVMADIAILRAIMTLTHDHNDEKTAAPLPDYLYILSFASWVRLIQLPHSIFC